MTRLRLFIAIDTPAEIKSQIGALRDRLASTGADVRWETDDKLHCTVKFLGDTSASLLEGISGILLRSGSATPPFVVRYSTVGCFPNFRDPRVVWIGMENGDGTLQNLYRSLEDALESLGFAREERKFHPHVTLGRVKSRRGIDNLLRTLETLTFDAGQVTLRQIELIKSELKPAGSVYTILKSIPLTA